MSARQKLQRPNTVIFQVPGVTSSRTKLPEIAAEVNKNFDPEKIACLQARGANSFLLSFKSQVTVIQAIEKGIKIHDQLLDVAQVSGGTTAVTITDAPFELPDHDLRLALSFYGDVKKIDHLKFGPEQGGYLNGDRKVILEMKKAVPNFLVVSGFELCCWYRDVAKVCRRCGETSHIAADCPTAVIKPRRCSNCGNRWHTVEDCKGCPTCKTEAHSADTCPAHTPESRPCETNQTETTPAEIPVKTEPPVQDSADIINEEMNETTDSEEEADESISSKQSQSSLAASKRRPKYSTEELLTMYSDCRLARNGYCKVHKHRHTYQILKARGLPIPFP